MTLGARGVLFKKIVGYDSSVWYLLLAIMMPYIISYAWCIQYIETQLRV